ncbi:hypothetical protein GDO86_019968 [Hymenochirus boettgeri]|uniref:G-protein coupled receptors family 1 profile domain-containing protein n=1 Tax=Hymenochirus boettgeri TaxID=247094 RepID=A0A8T2IG52_9PIPI|nr:hypothetical protein GDO86_019968 [Hymenochirus boettgeri]
MILHNQSCFPPSTFVLLGLPGLEPFHAWFSVPFFLMFLFAVVGNLSVLHIIQSEASLHQPMYIFLSVLSIVDLILANSTLPKLLSIFWFESNDIHYRVCLFQMFLVHAFSAIESGIFVVMALDRYVAICNPLRYSSILTTEVLIGSSTVAVLRGVVYILPLPLLAGRLSQYKSNTILHSYCEHMAVVGLSCQDVSLNDHAGIAVGFLVLIMDCVVIVLSYIKILRSLQRLNVATQLKSLATCTSHVCVIVAFYVPILTSSLVHRFGKNVSHHTHILLADLYLLGPPMLNPLVYGIRTKQIREKVTKQLNNKGVSFCLRKKTTTK